mmetsp:Transcript_9998/g.22777  ORF Transcript_9998/g.22777 Transcript_9998/m.22777 type:complete len:614 (-) Transcript_9998:82-1923(-)
MGEPAPRYSLSTTRRLASLNRVPSKGKGVQPTETKNTATTGVRSVPVATMATRRAVKLKESRAHPMSAYAIGVPQRQAAKLGETKRRSEVAQPGKTGPNRNDRANIQQRVSSTRSNAKVKKVAPSSNRSTAAKLGWEKRRQSQTAAPNESPSSKEDNTLKSSKSDVRSKAAKLGWERRKKDQRDAQQEAEKKRSKQQSSTEIRRKAAKIGWERRKYNQPTSKSTVPVGRNNAISSTHKQDIEPSDKNNSAGEGTSRAPRIYTASMRSKAAIVGWERRRNDKCSRMNTSTPHGVPPIETSPQKRSKREGVRCSKRLADESSDTIVDEAKNQNELSSYLILSRNWMEFHPSSRVGSGTATYGYFPSSIATFIRSGAITQKTVLDLGTLGVHYALDYEGNGGLKAMVETFGEDYAPYPTEAMMELSSITDWELGEDLPWREVNDAEEESGKAKEEAANSFNRLVDEDVLFVASILASLDQADSNNSGASAQKSHAAASEDLSIKRPAWQENATNVTKSNTADVSTALSALQGYSSSSSSDGSDSDNSEQDTLEERPAMSQDAAGGDVSPSIPCMPPSCQEQVGVASYDLLCMQEGNETDLVVANESSPWILDPHLF